MSFHFAKPFVVLCAVAMSASHLIAATIPGNSILAAGRANDVDVLDLNGSSIGSFSPLASGSDFNVTGAVQISAGGEIVLADQKNRFSRFDGNGIYFGAYSGLPALFYGQSLALDASTGQVFGSWQIPSGGAYVSRLDPSTGSVAATIDFGDVSIRDLVCGPDGYIYAATSSSKNVTIKKISPDLSTSTNFASYTTSGYNAISGLTFGADNNLYLGTYGDSTIVSFDGTTGASQGVFIPAGSGGLDKVTGLLFHPTTGNLLAGSYNTNNILEYDSSTGDYVGVFASGLASSWYMNVTPVPEPSSILISSLGLFGMLAYAWRKRKS